MKYHEIFNSHNRSQNTIEQCLQNSEGKWSSTQNFLFNLSIIFKLSIKAECRITPRYKRTQIFFPFTPYSGSYWKRRSTKMKVYTKGRPGAGRGGLQKGKFQEKKNWRNWRTGVFILKESTENIKKLVEVVIRIRDGAKKTMPVRKKKKRP